MLNLLEDGRRQPAQRVAGHPRAEPDPGILQRVGGFRTGHAGERQGAHLGTLQIVAAQMRHRRDKAQLDVERAEEIGRERHRQRDGAAAAGHKTRDPGLAGLR